MRYRIGLKVCMCVVLLSFFWGCSNSMVELRHNSQSEGEVPVQVFVSGFHTTASRTIAPSHIPRDDLADISKYKLRLDAVTGMGDSVTVDNFTLNNGVGILNLPFPGAWKLTLTASNSAGTTRMLQGETLLLVQHNPSSASASITLKPITDGTTGTVNVRFTILQSVVKRLVDLGANQVTVALYNDTTPTVAVQQQSFSLNNNGQNNVFTYDKNQVPSGRYTLKLTAPYRWSNATQTLTWSDDVHVEAGRVSSANITISEKTMAYPGNPYRRDKVNETVSASSPNFTQTTRFSGGEMVWLYATHWDGDGNGGDGNEVLVVAWSPVYDAEYYEVEVLVHPFISTTYEPSQYGKFDMIVTNDTDWNVLVNRDFRYGNSTKKPFHLKFSGNHNGPNYYKSKNCRYTITCVDGGTVKNFLTCADKNVAKQLKADGNFNSMANASYTVSNTQDAFDNYGIYDNKGKVGLEADCGILGILVPSYAPRASVVFRVRAGNQWGYSDWVYWKGGKW